MKKTLCMVFFLTVLAGTAGCGQKNTANTMEQTDTQTEKTLEEHFFSAEQDEQNYNVMEEYSEDEEYPDLAAFLTEYYQIPEEECKETRYYYNYTDLNEDGTDEIVAVTIGDTTSDNRGDAALILRPGENGQFEVLGAFSQIHTPVMISEDMENDGEEGTSSKYEFYVSDAAEKFVNFANTVMPFDISKANIVNIEEY